MRLFSVLSILLLGSLGALACPFHGPGGGVWGSAWTQADSSKFPERGYDSFDVPADASDESSKPEDGNAPSQKVVPEELPINGPLKF